MGFRKSGSDLPVGLFVAPEDPTSSLSTKRSNKRRRYCEGSEAIHRAAKKEAGLLRHFAPRNDEATLFSQADIPAMPGLPGDIHRHTNSSWLSAPSSVILTRGSRSPPSP